MNSQSCVLAVAEPSTVILLPVKLDRASAELGPGSHVHTEDTEAAGTPSSQKGG